MINVSVLGYGTIGSGVVEVIEQNAALIRQRAGDEVCVKSVLDLRDFEGEPIQERIVHDFEIIRQDAEVRIVVETMGGLHPAYEFVKASLESGKHVCTSNKALVAAYGPELLATAKEHSVNFLFEASVGGGIPIIRPLRTALAPDDIQEISGILNGTTNYILTEMLEKGADFNTVLKDAQDKGYAEKDPTADIEGHDACRKIAILTSLAYGKQVDFEEIYTEGITKVSDRDIAYIKKLQAKIKLVATSRKTNGQVSAGVAPVIVFSDNPLYNVDGVFNAVLVQGNMVGDLMFYGQGAGKLPTASAVVSDVIEAARHLQINIDTIWTSEKLPVGELGGKAEHYFVRVPGTREENRASVEKLFGFVTQVDAGFADEYAFIVPRMDGKRFWQLAQQLSVTAAYRVLTDAE